MIVLSLFDGIGTGRLALKSNTDSKEKFPEEQRQVKGIE